MAAFTWTETRARAAVLVAEDRLSNAEVAAAIGVSRQGLDKWIARAEFKTRVAEHVAEFEAATLRYEIAKRRRRVGALDDRWHRMQQVIEERAADEASGTYLIETDAEGAMEPHVAPGWKTGLLVRTEKVIGTGPHATRVTEYTVDTGLLKELRAHEEQAAKEVGQWSEKREITGKDGGPLEVQLSWPRALEQAWARRRDRQLEEGDGSNGHAA